jgi:Bacterial toxin YdaS
MSLQGLRILIEARGSAEALARLLSISPAAVAQWEQVPAERVCEIIKVTGIARGVLRPDLYGEPPNTSPAVLLPYLASEEPTTRQRLPNRRETETFEFEHLGLRFICSFSRDLDERVGEVFLQNHNGGSGIDVVTRDSAVAASLAMQHGCPIQTLQHACLRNPDGSAAGALGRALDLITVASQEQ